MFPLFFLLSVKNRSHNFIMKLIIIYIFLLIQIYFITNTKIGHWAHFKNRFRLYYIELSRSLDGWPTSEILRHQQTIKNKYFQLGSLANLLPISKGMHPRKIHCSATHYTALHCILRYQIVSVIIPSNVIVPTQKFCKKKQFCNYCFDADVKTPVSFA